MPPSGYDGVAVDAAVKFIERNFDELQQEVRKGKHADFKIGLRYEIRNITTALSKPPKNKRGKIQEGSLRLILAAYESLQDQMETKSQSDLKSSIRHVLENIRDALTKLHIDPDGNIMDRKV